MLWYERARILGRLNKNNDEFICIECSKRFSIDECINSSFETVCPVNYGHQLVNEIENNNERQVIKELINKLEKITHISETVFRAQLKRSGVGDDFIK